MNVNEFVTIYSGGNYAAPIWDEYSAYVLELVTDGDFPNGSTAWTLNGWTISDNAANCSGITANMIQTISGSTNKTYSLTFTISNYVSGNVTPAFVGGYDDSLNYSSNGTFTEVISYYSDIRFVFYGASFNGSIDNVSVTEVGESVEGRDCTINNLARLIS